ncbi:hypothetical protein DFR74_10562 [Nocardia puris]|uniref:Uncharacterized protein n=1 Tax=Nocardia puris TaxID=208602 RepID=A0A366DKQ3_9NOCA|nr:hypothetical protein DFR74_10562 [Nocardia puris]
MPERGARARSADLVGAGSLASSGPHRADGYGRFRIPHGTGHKVQYGWVA